MEIKFYSCQKTAMVIIFKFKQKKLESDLKI